MPGMLHEDLRFSRDAYVSPFRREAGLKSAIIADGVLFAVAKSDEAGRSGVELSILGVDRWSHAPLRMRAFMNRNSI